MESPNFKEPNDISFHFASLKKNNFCSPRKKKKEKRIPFVPGSMSLNQRLVTGSPIKRPNRPLIIPELPNRTFLHFYVNKHMLKKKKKLNT